MGREAQASWSGSAGLNPAQTLTLILVKHHSQAGPAWSSPDGIKGQDNIHVGSSVMSWEHQENSLELGTRVLPLWGKGAMDPLCCLRVLGRWRHKPCPSTFLLSLPCSAEGMDIKGVQCVSGTPGTQKCSTGLDHRAGNELATWMNWREKVHQEL